MVQRKKWTHIPYRKDDHDLAKEFTQAMHTDGYTKYNKTKITKSKVYPLFVHYDGSILDPNVLKNFYNTQAFKDLPMKFRISELRKVNITDVIQEENKEKIPITFENFSHSSTMSKSHHYNLMILDASNTIKLLASLNKHVSCKPLDLKIAEANRQRALINKEVLKQITNTQIQDEKASKLMKGSNINLRTKLSGEIRSEIINSIYSMTEPRFAYDMLRKDVNPTPMSCSTWINKMSYWIFKSTNRRLRQLILEDVVPYAKEEKTHWPDYFHKACRSTLQHLDPYEKIINWKQVRKFFFLIYNT